MLLYQLFCYSLYKALRCQALWFKALRFKALRCQALRFKALRFKALRCKAHVVITLQPVAEHLASH